MAREFVTSADRINFGTAPVLSTTFSLCFWFYPKSSAENYSGICNQDYNLGIYYRNATNLVSYYYLGVNHQTAFTFAVNTWHHLAVINNAENLSFYKNGVIDANTYTNTPAMNMNYLGHSGAGVEAYDGMLAELKAFDGIVLTVGEIAAVMRGVNIRPDKLAVYLPLYGVQSPEPDLSGKNLHGTVENTLRADHPSGISAVWLSPNPKRFQRIIAAVTYTEDITSTIISVVTLSDFQTFIESLLTTIQSLSSLSEVQAYLENLQTQISSVSTISETQVFVESLQTVAASVSSVSDVQAYIETVLTTIQSVSTLAEAQVYIETLSTTIQSVSTVTDTIGGFTEDLQSVIISVSAVDEMQAFIESLQSVIQSSSSVIDIIAFVENINTTILSISTVDDRQLFIENVAIIALSQASIADIMNYIEQVQTIAIGVGSVTDVLVGSFIGAYITGSTVAAREFESVVAAREFESVVAAR